MIGLTLSDVVPWLLAAALVGLGAALGAFAARRVPTILSPDGRRAWAFAAIMGGAGVFTLFAAVGLYMVRENLLYVLWLTLAVHVHLFVALTAFGWALGRRIQLEGNKEGARFSDQEAPLTTRVEATVTATVPAPGAAAADQGETG